MLSTRILVALAMVVCVAAGARAAVEIGDAGSLPASAQVTAGLGPLNLIAGTIETFDDVDVYQIHIEDLAAFSATVNPDPTLTQLVDTGLFLFDSLGRAVVGNDDPEPLNFLSRIPSGVLSGGPGTYYLAIALFPLRPVHGDEPIFVEPDPFDPSDPNPLVQFQLLVPASGLAVDGWEPTPNPDVSGGTGIYQIDLTGAQFATADVIPEPSAFVTLGVLLGLSACGLGFRRRAQRAC